ncbi:MAG: chromosome partition protein Smc [Steroidobacteraceae bacterium]
MRLTKIKLAGFKSFVDPTSVGFPNNLTGVVGPNGCGKSNVIDAVRWVMGELSARHLRGDSMTDVIFNGSSARKPVGTAHVELVFDNADGKISGPYASYSEVSLKRQVSRDGSSTYFINGARCRRRDITQLFLGTGLGSRSYAIIEQGMISRVIESKADDMRAFVEEAAGISRYKERRRETENRIADTRENLERLQDLRDEVDKQIRHLQRQAATARRYQAMKEDERRLTAEVLALRLRDLDSGADVHDSAMRECDLAMQAALADQRAAEAAIDHQRAFHDEQSALVSAVQGRYYEVGAAISRGEQAIQHARELHERRTADLAVTRGSLAEVALLIDRDAAELAALREEIGQLEPQLEEARRAEGGAAGLLEEVEAGLAAWQAGWETFNREFGAADQATQVERARIEQLEHQFRRLTGQADRLALERDALIAQESSGQIADLASRESSARGAAEALGEALGAALTDVQDARSRQLQSEMRLESLRAERERLRGEVLSLEALQKAALGRDGGKAGDWLAASGLTGRGRLAEQLSVDGGWERAVETALGDYLEAVCVDDLDAVAGSVGSLAGASVTLLEPTRAAVAGAGGESLAQRVRGPDALTDLLGHVLTADDLATALAMRHRLAADQSVITREGEWVGRRWLRVSRGVDHRAGVIEREQRLKTVRGEFAAAEERVRDMEAQIASLRGALAAAEQARDAAQARIQLAHREHADVLSQLEAGRARAQESTLRRERLDGEAADVAREIGSTQDALARARMALDQGLEALSRLDARRPQLEAEREERREQVASARQRAQAAQAAAQDLLIRSESRRSSEAGKSVNLNRLLEQRSQLEARASGLEAELAGGDEPVRELQQRLDEALGRRVEIEAELAAARRGLEEADASLRELDEKRAAAELRVGAAREAMEVARLAVQETRVRREAIAEQFAATRFELAAVLEGLAAEAGAEVLQWEERLAALRADIERLGQVNLAAIDELKENTERKEYLDRQYTDLTSALETLETVMRKIDRETRTRFEDTFNRINAGLQEKFPRLFGGGHAYLELVGEDPLAAGVAIMARPPGKRNSTISQLSGGEKALTAVALVFSIFDLNPAPFCLLDEVDAPLDEQNVGRFCDIVRDMSSRVQFIFITHNKVTMELAQSLLGVTMTEPGVSRLVAVDVDEAVRLATA